MKKYALFAALSLFSVFASANESGSNSPENAEYNYSQDLDIAKVVQITTDGSTTCGPVQAHMIYVDSHGVRHNLEYTRLADACENG